MVALSSLNYMKKEFEAPLVFAKKEKECTHAHPIAVSIATWLGIPLVVLGGVFLIVYAVAVPLYTLAGWL